VLLVTLLFGCAREAPQSGAASAAAGPGPAAAPAGPRSREGETCAATRDCEAGLRCVDAACARPIATRSAEYAAASGLAALARGDGKDAAARLERALAELDGAKEPAPVHLLCAHAQATLLAAGARDKVLLERAARALHRCVLTAPPASNDRAAALTALAGLERQGLDASLIARDQLVDAYLTGKPAIAAAEDLALIVSAPAATDKAFTRFVELLRSDAMRTRLAPCHRPWAEATQSDKLSATFKFRLKYYEADSEEYDKALLELEAPATPPDSSPASTAARSCLTDGLRAGAADYLKTVIGQRFLQEVTLTLAPR